MSDVAFSAWSLPTSVAPPPSDAVVEVAAGVKIRRLSVTARWLRTLTGALREARAALRARPAGELARTLGAAGSRFLDPGDPLRARALAALPATAGLSPEMATAVMDGMANDWTPAALARALRGSFAEPEVLDGFRSGVRGRVHAVGPELCVQVVSGSVPGVGATALLRSLLVKAPTLVKPGLGDSVLPTLLAQAIREEDPELGEALAVIYWPGGDGEVEAAALAEADVVTAYGGDEAVAALASRCPVSTRFVPYHHRVSLGVVGREGLSGGHRHQVASEVAGAVAFFDQRGCVSPQAIFVETGGDVAPAEFAREVAEALGALEHHLPGGRLDPPEASAIHQIRGSAELMRAAGQGVEVHHGGAGWWTVVYQPAARLAPACVGRVVRIHPVDDAVEDVPPRISSLRRHLQSVCVVGMGERMERLSLDLAGAGASRITDFASAPFPPPEWHHDGRGALEVLVRWVDLEV